MSGFRRERERVLGECTDFCHLHAHVTHDGLELRQSEELIGKPHYFSRLLQLASDLDGRYFPSDVSVHIWMAIHCMPTGQIAHRAGTAAAC